MLRVRSPGKQILLLICVRRPPGLSGLAREYTNSRCRQYLITAQSWMIGIQESTSFLLGTFLTSHIGSRTKYDWPDLVVFCEFGSMVAELSKSGFH